MIIFKGAALDGHDSTFVIDGAAGLVPRQTGIGISIAKCEAFDSDSGGLHMEQAIAAAAVEDDDVVAAVERCVLGDGWQAGGQRDGIVRRKGNGVGGAGEVGGIDGFA